MSLTRFGDTKMKEYSRQKPAKGRGERGFGLGRNLPGGDGISLTGWLVRYFGGHFLKFWNDFCNTYIIDKKGLIKQSGRMNA